MSLTAFLKENARSVEVMSYIASDRFIDEDGNPAEWKIRVLDSKEFDGYLKGAQKRVVDPKNPKAKVMDVDNDKLQDDLLRACIIEPNLADTVLQNSWNAIGEIDLLRKMLTAGEFAELAAAVMQASGFDTGMKERIEEAKN